MRVKDDEVSGFVQGPHDIAYEFFNLEGKSTDSADVDVVAKKVIDKTNKTMRHLAKTGTIGHCNGKLFNPFSPYSVRGEHNHVKGGRALYEFREIPKECFYQYVNFLQTKNEAYLRFAERGGN